MPYIKNSRRLEIDQIVEQLGKDIKVDGDLNYILFKFCKKYIKPSYNNYKNFLGELDCCAKEIYRKIVANYEEEKEKENGEVT